MTRLARGAERPDAGVWMSAMTCASASASGMSRKAFSGSGRSRALDGRGALSAGVVTVGSAAAGERGLMARRTEDGEGAAVMVGEAVRPGRRESESVEACGWVGGEGG